MTTTSRTYYDVLGLSQSASIDEIRQTFRREIARYHPDRVQHLGPEFAGLASTRAAELTEAYNALMNEDRKARYDERLRMSAVSADVMRESGPAPAEAPGGAVRSAPGNRSGRDSGDAMGAPVPDEFVRRAALVRFRSAVVAELGEAEEVSARGFDLTLSSKPRRALFRRTAPAMRLSARLVGVVDPEAVDQVWPLLLRATPEPDVIRVAFLMGMAVAPAARLAEAIAANRRRVPPQTVAPLLVPVSLQTWDSLTPADAPEPLKAILARLQST